VVRVGLPPLRERKEDLVQLVEHRRVKLLPETLALLGEYDWPGNVRELYNMLERAQAVAAPGQPLTPADLGVRIEAPDAAPVIEDFHLTKEQAVARWERAFLKQLLAASGNNVSRAARESGLGRTHLYRLLKKHGMTG
jgi:DNA-binding NtrC family response regulator